MEQSIISLFSILRIAFLTFQHQLSFFVSIFIQLIYFVGILSGDGLAVRSPRFSPDNKYLLWLERPAGGPHHGAHSLIRCTWENKLKVTVINRIMEQTTCADGDVFYGLYNQGLPKRCFVDSNKILLSTPHKYVVNLYLIDLGKFFCIHLYVLFK